MKWNDYNIKFNTTQFHNQQILLKQNQMLLTNQSTIINKSFFKVTQMKQVCHYYNLSDKGVSGNNVENAIDAIDQIEANNHQKAKLRINLSFNDLGKIGCESLRLKSWRHLQALNICNSNIGNQGCSILPRCGWSELQQINLIDNKIGDSGFAHLAKSIWPKLETIRLADNKISTQGCSALVVNTWNNLKEIYLSRCGITQQGCKMLVQAKWLKLYITLWQNQIGKKGCKYLLARKWDIYCQMKLIEQDDVEERGLNPLRTL